MHIPWRTSDTKPDQGPIHFSFHHHVGNHAWVGSLYCDIGNEFVYVFVSVNSFALHLACAYNNTSRRIGFAGPCSKPIHPRKTTLSNKQVANASSHSRRLLLTVGISILHRAGVLSLSLSPLDIYRQVGRSSYWRRQRRVSNAVYVP